jgi:uncharacterized membrane protein YgcG
MLLLLLACFCSCLRRICTLRCECAAAGLAGVLQQSVNQAGRQAGSWHEAQGVHSRQQLRAVPRTVCVCSLVSITPVLVATMHLRFCLVAPMTCLAALTRSIAAPRTACWCLLFLLLQVPHHHVHCWQQVQAPPVLLCAQPTAAAAANNSGHDGAAAGGGGGGGGSSSSCCC